MVTADCDRCGHEWTWHHGGQCDLAMEHWQCECPEWVESPTPVMTPEMMRGVPNTPGTPRRTIRVPDTLWDAAAAKAAERGESVSDVIRRALERYVRRK